MHCIHKIALSVRPKKLAILIGKRGYVHNHHHQFIIIIISLPRFGKKSQVSPNKWSIEGVTLYL